MSVLPTQFIDRQGYLNLLKDNKYVRVKDISRLQFTNTQDCDLAITQDGQLFHIILHCVIEVEGYKFKRVFFHEVGFLALTTCGLILHINADGCTVYSTKVLLDNVNFIVESLSEWTSGIDLIVNFTDGSNSLYRIIEGDINKLRDLDEQEYGRIISVNDNILINQEGLHCFKDGQCGKSIPGITAFVSNGDGNCLFKNKNDMISNSVPGLITPEEPLSEKEILNIRGELYVAIRWEYFVHWDGKKYTTLFPDDLRLDPLSVELRGPRPLNFD